MLSSSAKYSVTFQTYPDNIKYNQFAILLGGQLLSFDTAMLFVSE